MMTKPVTKTLAMHFTFLPNKKVKLQKEIHLFAKLSVARIELDSGYLLKVSKSEEKRPPNN